MAKKAQDIVGKISKRFLGKGASNALSELNPLAFLEEYFKYYREAQDHLTKRLEIGADLKKSLAELDAKKMLFLRFMEDSFAERAENFRRLFNIADEAIDKGDNENLAATLESVKELAQNSPLKDLASLTKVKENLAKKDHEWDL